MARSAVRTSPTSRPGATGKGAARWNVASRILAAVPANYLVTSLVTACAARLMAHGLGVNPAEASVAATLLSFVVFATIALFAFGLRSITRLWLWLLVGGAVSGGLLWLSLGMGGRL